MVFAVPADLRLNWKKWKGEIRPYSRAEKTMEDEDDDNTYGNWCGRSNH